MSGCGSSDEAIPPPPAMPPSGSALVVPGVNPAFDTVTETATSESAGGEYAPLTGVEYDSVTETVTLPEDEIPEGGAYVRITGDATIAETTAQYTVYTFVNSNATEVAANELTSLAVGLVADGSASDFAAGVGQVAGMIDGVTAADITAPDTETERHPAVRAAMIALSDEFRNSAFVPGASDPEATAATVNTCVALGALAYDDMSRPQAGGSGTLPPGEPHRDYQRCVACHGWDQLGMEGGFARRARLESQPNAGFGDPDQLSRNISVGARDIAVTVEMILAAGSGRRWDEGSAIFDGTDPWGPGTQTGNEHPDLSPNGANNGAVPSGEQVRCMAAFLNHPSSQANAVFASVDPDPATPPAWCEAAQCVDYEIVPGGDAARGDDWYHDPAGGDCVSCHGEPGDAAGPQTSEPPGGLLVYLAQDGAFSALRHSVQWGVSGSDVMTRANMGEPTVADVTDLVAYLMAELTGPAGGPPSAVNDSASTMENTAVDIDVLANDTDADNDPLSISAFDATSENGGTVSCTTAGVCTYSPASGFTGTDTFSYTVSDGSATDSATVTITVSTAGNSAPIAVNDTASTSADTDVVVDVLQNDSDPDGDSLTVSAFDSSSANGASVSCTPTGDCTYMPNTGFTGQDTFDYTVSDGTDTDTARVTVSVSAPGNDAPIARNDNASTTQNMSVQINVLANDSDPDNDPLTVSAFDSTSTEGGTVNCTNGGNCTYNPPNGFTGSDSFSYSAFDGMDTDSATVTVTVTAPANNPPVARNDSATTTENTAVNINVRANDSDPDGDALTVSAFDSSSANGGSVSCSNAGNCTYTPPNGFTGNDTFGYTISDGEDTDSATVTIQVNAGNPNGDPAAGEARYDAECHVCHSYEAYGDNSEQFGAGDLGGQSDKLRNNLGSIDSMMSGITLTDQELLDMAAFLEAH